jgi:MATE family, multidrug efflux pump
MRDLTQGKLTQHLSTIATALIVEMLSATLNAMANIFWFGKLGADAQAAATLVANPLIMIVTLMSAIAMGARVLIGHAVGAGAKDQATRVFNEAIGASLLATLAFMACTWPVQGAIAHGLTGNLATAALIKEILPWYIPAIALQFPFAVLSYSLAATGSVRPAVAAKTGSVFVNLILTPLLVFGWLGAPKMGFSGAGASYLISVVISVAGLVYYLVARDGYLTIRPRMWRPSVATVSQLLKIGLPSGVQGIVGSGSLLVITVCLNYFGPSEIAAFGIGARIYQTAMLPFLALGSATSVVVAQNFGARLSERVRQAFKAATAIGLVVVPVAWAIVYFLAHGMSAAFSNDPAVVAGSVRYLQIMSYTILPECIILCCFGALTGLGNTVASLLTSTLYAVALSIGALFFTHSLRQSFQADWLWWMTVACTVGELLIALHILRRDFGRKLGVPLSASSVSNALQAPRSVS